MFVLGYCEIASIYTFYSSFKDSQKAKAMSLRKCEKRRDIGSFFYFFSARAQTDFIASMTAAGATKATMSCTMCVAHCPSKG